MLTLCIKRTPKTEIVPPAIRNIDKFSRKKITEKITVNNGDKFVIVVILLKEIVFKA